MNEHLKTKYYLEYLFWSDFLAWVDGGYFWTVLATYLWVGTNKDFSLEREDETLFYVEYIYSLTWFNSKDNDATTQTVFFERVMLYTCRKNWISYICVVNITFCYTNVSEWPIRYNTIVKLYTRKILLSKISIIYPFSKFSVRYLHWIVLNIFVQHWIQSFRHPNPCINDKHVLDLLMLVSGSSSQES